MANKQVYIGDLRVGYCTSAKITAETKTESTPTFDGPVTEGTADIPHTVEIERLRYAKITDYKTLSKVLHDMLSTPQTITIKENVKMVDGRVVVTDRVYKCLVSSDEYELNPEEATAESLKFSGGKRSRWIDGEKIY